MILNSNSDSNLNSNSKLVTAAAIVGSGMGAGDLVPYATHHAEEAKRGKGRSVDGLNLNGKVKKFGPVFKRGFLLNRPKIKIKSAILTQGTSASGPIGSSASEGYCGGSIAATGKGSDPRVDMPTVGHDVCSDVEVDISVGAPGYYGLEALLDEWLKGVESSLGPLHEELIRGWNALDAER